ncbi:MAG: hypothetical protein HJJLKODD_02448 [Phycisphaerae bacterium]|nr:hypothetical protein [Phycisphaerae bacterium]
MDDATIAQKALKIHEELDREVDLLRLRMASKPDAHGDHWLTAFASHFRHFHTQLRSHFEMEEEGGFMKPVVDKRPTLSPQIARLREEHRQMRHLCYELEMFVEECRAPSLQQIAHIRERSDEIIDCLKAHEKAENQLIQDAFQLDLGSSE